jgi:hypothetical protein
MHQEGTTKTISEWGAQRLVCVDAHFLRGNKYHKAEKMY